MKIELAKSAGFCFGVKRAVDTVYDVLKGKKEGPVHTLGPIIHNEQVVSELEERGVTAVNGIEELEGEKDATLIIRVSRSAKRSSSETGGAGNTLCGCNLSFCKKNT